jgi:hypothetical protein
MTTISACSLADQVGPVALGELLNRVAPLLDHRGQRLLALSLVSGSRFSMALFFSAFLISRSVRALRVVRLHCDHNLLADKLFSSPASSHG